VCDALDYEAQVVDCRIAELLALTELRNGTATVQDVTLLKSTVLIVRELAPDLSFMEIEADDLSARHYPALLALWQEYDAIRATITRRDYLQAIEQAKQRRCSKTAMPGSDGCITPPV
jgi:hypothetical protein